jgi:hypothetical protein
MANTNILIKRSNSVGRPGSLLAGELAYSYASNTIFIGSPTGNGVVNVGGQYYTSQVDNATAAATGLTLVRRDATGNAAFNFITANIIGTIQGTANAAVQLENSRNFSISGGDITASAVGFNGTADVTLNTSLNAVPGLGAGTYGSTTAIPVIQVAANGRVMNVTTAAITTSFTVAGDSGTPQTVSGGDTLTLVGGAGITSVASATDTVTFDVDNTVVRANAFTGGTQTINTNLTIGSGKDLTVTGNLIITGNVVSENVTQFAIQDPLLVLGIGNYYTDTKDIGFAAHYNDGSNAHTGLIRDSNASKEYYFFEGYIPDVDANNNVNITDPSFRKSNVHVNYLKGNVVANTISTDTITTTGNVTIGGNLIVAQDIVIDDLQVDVITANTLTLTNALTVPNGGTGKTSFTSGQIVIGSGVNGLTQIANSTVAVGQTFGSASSVAAFETDVYGRVVAVSNTSIAIDASAITSGTLPIARGGTNGTSFTDNQITYFDGTKIASLANTTYTQTGTLASNNTITSITVDGFGRFTAATVGAISGLTVAQGGTGLSTITQNGITYGNGTGNLGVTAAAGTADQTWSNQILTVTNAGVPVWTTSLDGGQF